MNSLLRRASRAASASSPKWTPKLREATPTAMLASSISEIAAGALQAGICSFDSPAAPPIFGV